MSTLATVVGLLLLVAAAGLVSVPLGVAVAGLCLIAVGELA